MWTWSRGSAILTAKTHRDSIPMIDLIKMLEKSKPVRVPGTAVFLTNDPASAPSSFMHNLKHNKVVHERVVMMCVRTETSPRVPAKARFEIKKLSPDFLQVTLHFGYMESPRIPNALAVMRKSGLKFDIMTTSFFLGRRTLKPAENSGMPQWQDQLFIAMTRQAASAPDFFHIPSDRVVELGAPDEGVRRLNSMGSSTSGDYRACVDLRSSVSRRCRSSFPDSVGRRARPTSESRSSGR